MVSLGFEKKIVAIVLNIIDKATDLFQAQDNKIRDIELRLDALEHYLKDKNK